jgi:hypothetical protein
VRVVCQCCVSEALRNFTELMMLQGASLFHAPKSVLSGRYSKML